VVCIDFPKNIYTDEEIDFQIGPAPAPEPDPDVPPPVPPTPDVPPDVYDNIGQRVAQWTKGLPANAAIGAIYLKHAKLLRGGDLNSTITEQGAKLKAELNATPGYTQYTTFATNLNADLSQRWAARPLGKGELADYWTFIALGLGVK
jgi:hypothetical protein